MKFHTSLPVISISKSKKFYSTLFDSIPAKEEEGYLKYLPDEIDLNISFIRSKQILKGLHLGFEVQSSDELDELHKRLEDAGLVETSEKNREDSVCCFARQDKFWVVDPSGYEWEIYTVISDTKIFASEGKSSCCAPVGSEDPKAESEGTSGCCDNGGGSTQCG